MKKFKIIVKSPEESKAAQEALFAMGYRWRSVATSNLLYADVLFADKYGTITWSDLAYANRQTSYPLYILHILNEKPFLIPEEIPVIHRDVYVAWEQGKETEYLSGSVWRPISHPPSWSTDMSYRVKPLSDKKPHKHAELIKAWADGAEIQALCAECNDWIECTSPAWYEHTCYRIKPEEKAIQTLYLKSAICDVTDEGIGCGNINVNLSEHYVVITYNPNTKAIEDITWKGKAF